MVKEDKAPLMEQPFSIYAINVIVKDFDISMFVKVGLFKIQKGIMLFIWFVMIVVLLD